MANSHTSIGRQRVPSPGLIAYCSVGFSLLKLRNAPPHSVRFHIIRGRIRFCLGQYEQAITDFRRALRLDWRHGEAAYWLDRARNAISLTSETEPLT